MAGDEPVHHQHVGEHEAHGLAHHPVRDVHALVIAGVDAVEHEVRHQLMHDVVEQIRRLVDRVAFGNVGQAPVEAGEPVVAVAPALRTAKEHALIDGEGERVRERRREVAVERLVEQGRRVERPRRIASIGPAKSLGRAMVKVRLRKRAQALLARGALELAAGFEGRAIAGAKRAVPGEHCRIARAQRTSVERTANLADVALAHNPPVLDHPRMQSADVARGPDVVARDQVAVEIEDVALVGEHRARAGEPGRERRRIFRRRLDHEVLCVAREEPAVFDDLPAIVGREDDHASTLHRPTSTSWKPRSSMPSSTFAWVQVLLPPLTSTRWSPCAGTCSSSGASSNANGSTS